MDKLKSLIEAALVHSNFNEQLAKLSAIYSMFHNFNDVEIAKLYAQKADDFANTELKVSDNWLKKVEKEVLIELHEFITEDDRFNYKSIGIGYDLKDNISTGLDVSEFTKNIVKAAALMGPQTVVNFLQDWKIGKPLEFECRAKILGATGKASILKYGEVRIVSPQELSSKDINFFHALSAVRNVGHEYEKLATIIIGYQRSPALYNLNDYKKVNKELESCKISKFNIESLCRNLTLECGVYIMPTLWWIDLGPIWPLLPSTTYGINYKYIDENPREIITKSNLAKAYKLAEIRGKMKNKKIDIAVASCAESLNYYTDNTNRFFNLRMALESLLVNKKGQSNTKQISTKCAFLLGNSTSQKENIYKEMNRFYKVASEIIHPFLAKQAVETDNYLYPQNNTSSNMYTGFELLRKAFNNCRNLIELVLENQKLPNWQEYFNRCEAIALQNKMAEIMQKEDAQNKKERIRNEDELKKFLASKRD